MKSVSHHRRVCSWLSRLPRGTKDIDLWIATDPANISRFVTVLKNFGFDLPALNQWRADPRKTLRMGYPPFRIEVLTQIAGVEFAEAYSKRVGATLDDVPVAFIGLEHLRANNRAAGRAQDLADLENLP